MSKKTPTIDNGILHLFGSAEEITLDSDAWFAWLNEEEHHSFHFNDAAGCFTARKERKQRGQWYWVAYRQSHNKLHKTYLGKSKTLTVARLRAAAHILQEEIDAP